MLMVMERVADTESLTAGSPESAAVLPPVAPKVMQVETPAPAAKVIEVETAPAPEVIKVQLPAPPATAPAPPAIAAAPQVAVPVPSPAAARVLTDAEVTNMLQGVWQLNDGAGVLQMNFDANGTYRSYREVKDPSTFYNVFVKAPVAAGTWSVQNGSLIIYVTSSTDLTRVNHTFQIAVRSISPMDFIFVDPVGRVGKAVRLQ
jgi:hypothetical protein